MGNFQHAFRSNICFYSYIRNNTWPTTTSKNLIFQASTIEYSYPTQKEVDLKNYRDLPLFKNLITSLIFSMAWTNIEGDDELS